MSGLCTGSFTLQIDAACSGTYNLAVGGTAVQPLKIILPPQIYYPEVHTPWWSLCMLSSYAATVFDIITFIPIPLNTSNFNFTPPSYLLNTLASKAPLCNASCNGSMTLSIAGGTPLILLRLILRFRTDINGRGFTIGGMCGAPVIYTFTIKDKTVVREFQQIIKSSATLLANGSTQV